MISTGSILYIVDNSGALTCKCIGIKGSTKKNSSSPGTLLTVVIKTCSSIPKNMKKGLILNALVVKTKFNENRFNVNGETIKFRKNSVILTTKKDPTLPMATRIFGYVSSTLRQKKLLKIILLAQGSV